MRTVNKLMVWRAHIHIVEGALSQRVARYVPVTSNSICETFSTGKAFFSKKVGGHAGWWAAAYKCLWEASTCSCQTWPLGTLMVMGW